MSISAPTYLTKFETMRKDLYVEILKCSNRLKITFALHVLWQPYVFLIAVIAYLTIVIV